MHASPAITDILTLKKEHRRVSIRKQKNEQLFNQKRFNLHKHNPSAINDAHLLAFSHLQVLLAHPNPLPGYALLLETIDSLADSTHRPHYPPRRE